MSAELLVAGGATVIALGSLWVSVVQSRSTIRHNRQSVRPLIQVRQVRLKPDRRAGLLAVNAGLGPALVTSTEVYYDGTHLGQWNLSAFHHVFAGAPREPVISALFTGSTLLPGNKTYLLLLDPFDDTTDAWFWEIVANRLRIEIHYESLYGGEDFHAAPPPL
ncbi:hypothetical protein [Streptomyces sp. NBC_01477]|uniref:hypothetical protein n=1 Tax=Streptomyces sp. NBC_01477 TaxID=2976015 RepID=UPI002E35A120|nr:hypothetical protein [Streptomyces sp. NBC_01477]